MSDIHTDLVIQISTSESASSSPITAADSGDESRLVAELRKCLRPGVEIALVFSGYTAMTSILWLTGPLPDGGLRAGVRLVGVSAPLPKQSELSSSWGDSSEPASHSLAASVLTHAS